MGSYLFELPYDDSNLDWVIKLYFNTLYEDGLFLDAIKNIAQKISFSIEGLHCIFPDMNSFYEEEHFEGVEFSYGFSTSSEGEYIIRVSDDVCFQYVQSACEKYLKYHPENTKQVNYLLLKSLLNPK